MLAISVNVVIESKLIDHVLDSVPRLYVLLSFLGDRFGLRVALKETVRWVIYQSQGYIKQLN